MPQQMSLFRSLTSPKPTEPLRDCIPELDTIERRPLDGATRVAAEAFIDDLAVLAADLFFSGLLVK